MTHPITSTETAYENEEDYRARTRKPTLIVALVVTVAFVALIVVALVGNYNRAMAATVPQAALASEPTVVYPGGDPGAELSYALENITPLLGGSLGSLGSLGNQPGVPQPPQGELPPLDNPAAVTTFCDREQATLQVAGIAPDAGRYIIVYSPSVDLHFTLLDAVLAKGEKIWLLEPVPEGTSVNVSMQIGEFSGTIDVPTPICR